MADDQRPLDPDDFDKTQVARDPALRALDAGATELLPRTARGRTSRRTETVVTDQPRRPFEPAWWMGLVAVGLVVAAIVAALALTDDDDEDAVEPDVSATSIVVPTSQFVTPTTAPPPGATTTVAPATDPPATTEPLPPGPTIVSFTGPASVTCTEPTDIELSWETTDATNATIAMERTIVATVAPSGSQLVEFPCDGESHNYVLTAADDEGQATQQVLSVTQN